MPGNRDPNKGSKQNKVPYLRRLEGDSVDQVKVQSQGNKKRDRAQTLKQGYDVWAGQPYLKSPGWDRVEYRPLEAREGNYWVIKQESEERRQMWESIGHAPADSGGVRAARTATWPTTGRRWCRYKNGEVRAWAGLEGMNETNTLGGEDNGTIFLLVPFPSLKLFTIVST